VPQRGASPQGADPRPGAVELGRRVRRLRPGSPDARARGGLRRPPAPSCSAPHPARRGRRATDAVFGRKSTSQGENMKKNVKDPRLSMKVADAMRVIVDRPALAELFQAFRLEASRP